MIGFLKSRKRYLLVSLVSAAGFLTFFDYLSVLIATVGLFFNGYVWWGSLRDKEIESLGKVRGGIYQLDSESNFFFSLDELSEERYRAIGTLQEIAKKIAGKIAEALGNAGSFITSPTYVEARKFVTNLIMLSRKDFELVGTMHTDWTFPLQHFEEKWKDITEQASHLSDVVGKEIESYKFRHFVGRRLRLVLDYRWSFRITVIVLLLLVVVYLWRYWSNLP